MPPREGRHGFYAAEGSGIQHNITGQVDGDRPICIALQATTLGTARTVAARPRLTGCGILQHPMARTVQTQYPRGVGFQNRNPLCMAEIE